MAEFDKKVAFVTGASKGLGRALSLRLARDGYHVVALARSQDKLESLDDEIQAMGGSCTLIPQDLQQVNDLYQLGPMLFEKFGRLDVLVLNAAILGPLTPVAQVDKKDWDKVLNVDLNAPFALLQTCDPIIRATPKAQVVGMVSGRILDFKAYWSPYTVAKSGLNALLEIYKREVRHTGVKVHAFNPVRVNSEIRSAAYPGEEHVPADAPENVAERVMALLNQTETKDH